MCFLSNLFAIYTHRRVASYAYLTDLWCVVFVVVREGIYWSEKTAAGDIVSDVQSPLSHRGVLKTIAGMGFVKKKEFFVNKLENFLNICFRSAVERFTRTFEDLRAPVAFARFFRIHDFFLLNRRTSD